MVAMSSEHRIFPIPETGPYFHYLATHEMWTHHMFDHQSVSRSYVCHCWAEDLRTKIYHGLLHPATETVHTPDGTFLLVWRQK